MHTYTLTKSSSVKHLLFLPHLNVCADLSPPETLPADPWLVPGVSHANMSSSSHAPAAEPAQVTGPRSHAGGLPDRTSSRPGGFCTHDGMKCTDTGPGVVNGAN